MKTLKLIAVVALVALSAAFSSSVSAKENETKEAKEKVARGPYLSNRFIDGWFVGVAGGINVFGDGGYKPALGGELDATVGKWILPTVAARVGYSGLTGAMWSAKSSILGSELVPEKDMYKQRFGFAYLHADALWNISNEIGGYKERLWDFIPYAHTGVVMSYNRPEAEHFYDREFGVGLGLLNEVRLHKRVDLTLDLRALFVCGRQHCTAGLAAALQAAVGVSVNLGEHSWTRAADYHNPEDVAALADMAKEAEKLVADNKALAEEKAQLTKANEELAAEVVELSKRPIKAALEDVGPASVYFEIGQTTLSQKELQHLDFYLKNVLPNVGDKKVAVITGSADSKTGTVRRNKYLSQKRVDYVMNILSEKYGIEADRFQVRTQVAKEGDAALNRAVIISFE